MSKNIFVACDTTNLNKVRKIIRYTQSKKLKIGYKFGLEFFYSKSGRSFLSKMDKKTNNIFRFKTKRHSKYMCLCN